MTEQMIEVGAEGPVIDLTRFRPKSADPSSTIDCTMSAGKGRTTTCTRGCVF